MADLGRPVVIHHHQGRAGHGVDLSRLAAAMGLPVKGGEPADHLPREFHLPEHEDPLPGNEDLVEDEGRAVFAVADISAIDAFDFPGVHRISSHDVDEPFRIGRNGKGHGIILVAFSHGPGRKHDDFVAAERSGLVNLGPFDDDPFFGLIDDPKVHVFVRLLMGAQDCGLP